MIEAKLWFCWSLLWRTWEKWNPDLLPHSCREQIMALIYWWQERGKKIWNWYVLFYVWKTHVRMSSHAATYVQNRLCVKDQVQTNSFFFTKKNTHKQTVTHLKLIPESLAADLEAAYFTWQRYKTQLNPINFMASNSTSHFCLLSSWNTIIPLPLRHCRHPFSSLLGRSLCKNK